MAARGGSRPRPDPLDTGPRYVAVRPQPSAARLGRFGGHAASGALGRDGCGGRRRTRLRATPRGGWRVRADRPLGRAAGVSERHRQRTRDRRSPARSSTSYGQGECGTSAGRRSRPTRAISPAARARSTSTAQPQAFRPRLRDRCSSLAASRSSTWPQASYHGAPPRSRSSSRPASPTIRRPALPDRRPLGRRG